MEKKIFSLFLVSCFLFSFLFSDVIPSNQTSTIKKSPVDTTKLVKDVGPGTVNWTDYTITAKGWAIIDSSLPMAQAKAMARRGAEVVAQRNLLEIIKGVNVYSETKVQDFITKSDYVYTKIEGVVKNAVIIGEPIEKDGTIEVSMGIKIYDTDGLASAIQKEMPSKNNAKMQLTGTEKTNLSKIEKLAVDITGIDYEPGIFPRILDEDGNMIFDASDIDLSKIDYEKAIEYVQNPDELKKDVDGNNTLKAVKKVGSDIIIALKDPKTQDWLKKAFDFVITAGKAVLLFI